MRFIIPIFMCVAALAVDIPISWRLDKEASAIQLDIRKDGEVVESRIFRDGATNALLNLDVGRYEVSAVALGSVQWITNAQTGEVWATNAVVSSQPSNVAIIRILPAPRVSIMLQSADSPEGEWVDTGLTMSYDLREVDRKYIRAVVVQAPPKLPIHQGRTE